MQESSVVTPSNSSFHKNVSSVKVDLIKISLQNEKHHCRIGRVSAAMVWSLSSSTQLELEPHLNKGGGNLPLEKKSYRWQAQTLTLYTFDATSSFCHYRSLKKGSTSKPKKCGFQTKHIQKPKITHIVLTHKSKQKNNFLFTSTHLLSKKEGFCQGKDDIWLP